MPKSTVIPAVFFIAASLVVLLLGISWQQSETNRIRTETAVTGAQVVLRLQACTDSRASLAMVLAGLPWLNEAELLQDWLTRASTLYPLHSGILALNFVDRDWIIQRVYPEAENAVVAGYNLREHPSPIVVATLAAAERSGFIQRTETIDLLQGGSGIALYLPIRGPDDAPLGFVNGVFRLDALMDSCLAEQPLRNRFSFRIRERADSNVIFQLPATGYVDRPGHAYRQGFDVIGKPWLLEISPTDNYYRQQSEHLPWLETGLGLLLVLAMSLLLGSHLRKQQQLLDRETENAHALKMQALGNMAGGIAHDFNNVLQVLGANLEFLAADYPHDTHLQKELGALASAVERGQTLVARLAGISRLEPVQREAFELNAYIADLCTLLERTLPETITLHCSMSQTPLPILADKSQLEQTLLNICFNARDAMEGRGTLHIQLDSQPADALPAGLQGRAYASIRISDSGPGIPAHVLPKIFEPYFTTKERGSGTGLGLANCYNIVKQHGGEIIVESPRGRGAVFTVYLPLQST